MFVGFSDIIVIQDMQVWRQNSHGPIYKPNSSQLLQQLSETCQNLSTKDIAFAPAGLALPMQRQLVTGVFLLFESVREAGFSQKQLIF